jgi:hypothetical protein
MQNHLSKGIMVCILAYVIFGIQWSHTRESMHKCFEPKTITLPALFKYPKKPLWTKKEQTGIPPHNWNLPLIEHFYDPSSMKYFSNTKILGYLKPSQNQFSVSPFSENTKVKLTGNIIISSNGVFEEFLNNTSVVPSLEIEINSELYLVYLFSLSDDIKKIYISNSCYKSDSSV